MNILNHASRFYHFVVSVIIRFAVVIAMIIPLQSFAAPEPLTIQSPADCSRLLETLNHTFGELSGRKERGFWATKMGLSGASMSQYGIDDEAMSKFSQDSSYVLTLKEALLRGDLSQHDRLGLQAWLDYFEAQTISNPEAQKFHRRLREAEGELQARIKKFNTGYVDPATQGFVKATIVELGNMRTNDPVEARRRAAFEGMRAYEREVLRSGFLKILKIRRRLAKSLGFKNYYEMQLHRRERMTEEELFSLLRDLEENTNASHAAGLQRVAREKGEASLLPWNYQFVTSGDATHSLDPYLPFEKSVSLFVRTFAGLGADFKNATVHIDLVDRPGKFQNGFMHLTQAPYVLADGTAIPAHINLMSNALPSQVGSGYDALQTLAHEFGHTLHFANVSTPSPANSQEFAPTTAFYAETQSMFADTHFRDPGWLFRHAKDMNGNRIPKELIMQLALVEHRNMTFDLRWMMTVPFVEKYLYSLPEARLTIENIDTILAKAREIETRLLGTTGGAPRPVFSVAHLLEEDMSAGYHGYLVAQMAVNQTRAHFMEVYGYILDNPKIFPDLRRAYWQAGNSKPFPQMIKDLTGKDFSAQPTIALAARSEAEVIRGVDEELTAEARIPHFSGSTDLNLRLYVDDGDTNIANNVRDGANGFGTIEEVETAFSNWIAGLRTAANAARNP